VIGNFSSSNVIKNQPRNFLGCWLFVTHVWHSDGADLRLRSP